MQMQLSSDVRIPDGLLAANALLAENSRQGSATLSHTLHQGFYFAISSTSLGISGSLYDGRTGCRYTGKERDSESGNDYFGARYFASNMGRFTSPDWSAEEEPVPYAKLGNPQTLNLYAYVGNNPMSRADIDGHTDEAWLEEHAPQVAEANAREEGVFGGAGASEQLQNAAATSRAAQQQSSSTTANANPNAAAEQHQYDLVVGRTNKLLGTDDAADHIDPNGKLVGGNYEFSINNSDKSDATFRSSLNSALGEADGDKGAHGGLTPPTHRVGFSTSLHHDNDALHVDHFNGAKFPVGSLLHVIVDVGIGHLPYYGSNHAFSYSGVQ
jgi:RHS repeat-associated protein